MEVNTRIAVPSRKITLGIAILITLALVWSRFVDLGKFPPGLSNDETEYVVSGKSYSLHGRDVSGYGLPLSLIKSETDGVISPIPAIMSAPFLTGRQLNLATARWPYATANIITAVGIFFIIYLLTKNTRAGWVGMIWFLVNPWSVYMAHNTADAPMALMFYVWGVVLYLKNSGAGLIPAMILFTAGFFSYHGAKPQLLPLVLVISFYRYKWAINKLSLKQAGLMIVFAASLTAMFVLAAKKIPGAIILGGENTTAVQVEQIKFAVNESRRKSIEAWFSPVFVNKYTETIKVLTEKYLNTFSLNTLFLSGDERATYHFGRQGLFYLFDTVLILIGAVTLFRKKPQAAGLLLLIIFIAPVSTVISSVETSVINRSFMLLPSLIIFAGYGLYFLAKSYTKAIIVILIATISVLNFWQWWRYQNPVQGANNYWLAERVAAKYMQLEDPRIKIIYVTNEPWNELVRQIFYAGYQDQIYYLKKTYPYSRSGPFDYKNITMTNVCPSDYNPKVVYVVKRGMNNCFEKKGAGYTITDMRDAGDVFRIFNGTLCDGKSTDVWRRFNLESDFEIDNMDTEQFCRRWINLAK